MTTTTAALGATGYAVLNKNPARDLTAVGSGVFGFGLAFVCYQVRSEQREGANFRNPANIAPSLPSNLAYATSFVSSLVTPAMPCC